VTASVRNLRETCIEYCRDVRYLLDVIGGEGEKNRKTGKMSEKKERKNWGKLK
jgi:hypothetical protein